MDIQRAAELLAARSTKDFGNALKDRGDPFKDFYKSLPICILDAVFSIGVRYTSVVNVVNCYMATFDLTISRTQTDETEHTIRDFLTNVAKYDTVEDFSKNVLHNMQRTSSRNGILKAEACREVALVCQKHGINKSLSQYVRDAAMGKDETVIDGMDDLIRELRRQGNNLNQLVVMARQGHVELANMEPFMEVYENTWQTLNSLLSRVG